MNEWFEKIEGTLGPREAAYRESHLESDIRLMMICSGLWQAANCIFSYSDYLLFGWGEMFFFHVGLRLTLLLVTVGLTVQVKRKRSYQDYDWAMFWAWMTTAVIFITIVLHRPSNYLQSYTLDIILIFSMYMIVPNRLIFRVIPAVLFTLSSIFVLLYVKTELSLLAKIVTLISYAMCNFLGLIGSVQMFRYRRQEFTARMEEGEIREELRMMLVRDELTGCYNRRWVFELGERELQRSQRTQIPFTVLLLDLDHFKNINDCFGHMTGDEILRQFAGYIQDQTRSFDCFGRIGGEEFLLILCGTDWKEGAEIGERIRRGISFLTVPGKAEAISVTVSIGVAEAAPEDETFTAVVEKADRAMYQAKQKGRNRVVVWKEKEVKRKEVSCVE